MGGRSSALPIYRREQFPDRICLLLVVLLELIVSALLPYDRLDPIRLFGMVPCAPVNAPTYQVVKPQVSKGMARAIAENSDNKRA